jgi:multidrug efflux pump subunit AcrB
MWLVIAALRRPITVIVAVVGLIVGASLAVARMPRDIFPDLEVPVVYVTQTWPGMTPAQVEGLIVSKYEDHFLYIAGIEHIESRSVQGVTMLKLYFHPGTDTSYAVAQVTAMAYRAAAFMPPGTLPPFIMRLDQGAFPAAQLVFESKTRSDTEIQDLALYKVRPILATLPGVSAPPPFGGKARMIMVSLDPDRLRAYGMSPEEVAVAIANTNVTLPEGAVRLNGTQYITQTNNTVPGPQQLNDAPLRMGHGATVYLRDVGVAEDGGDVHVSSALVNGRRAVYMPITKRAGASTLAVVDSIYAKLPEMRNAIPADIGVHLEFDQSTYVRNAIKALAIEGLSGALLTGLVVALFIRDLRSALIVVLSIPTSIFMALIALALAKQTINIMTLGGLALAVGILVDEASVAIENIHVHLARGKSPALAVRDAMSEVQTPRLVAMLCVCAVFIPSFYMVGVGRALFGALALAVGLAMVASYLMTSTLVPVLASWLLRRAVHHGGPPPRALALLSRAQERLTSRLMVSPRVAVLAFVGGFALVIAALGASLPQELFPLVNADKFQLRVRGPDGLQLERTEDLCRDVLATIGEEVGRDNVDITIGNIGPVPGAFPVSAQYVWNSGPQELLLLVGLKPGRVRSLPRLEDALRGRFAARFPGVGFTFEPADVISQVLSGATPNSVKVLVSGNRLEDVRSYAESIRDELAKEPGLRDLAIPLPLDYPTLRIDIDRERAAQLGTPADRVGRSLVEATWSSQFTQLNLWVDQAGLGYFVAVRLPESSFKSLEDLENLAVMPGAQERPLLRDLATVTETTSPGEYDHWNSIRTIPITANSADRDLARLGRAVDRAIARAGAPPSPDIKVAVQGLVRQMRETLGGLQQGLLLAIVVVVLLLSATFQSFRDAFAVLLAVPGTVAGVLLALAVTGTTLNIQSFIGAIMSIGVAVANAVLVVKFFGDRRREGLTVGDAARAAATARTRAVLMTSVSMLAGMLPMAFGLGEAGEQNAPLAIAVIGGLSVSTLVTLLLLPTILVAVHGEGVFRHASLDPADPESAHFEARATE